MREFSPEPVNLNVADPIIGRLYRPLFDMATRYYAVPAEERDSTPLVSHLEYMKRILGDDLGGHLVGSALNDAKHLADIPEHIVPIWHS